MYALTAHTGGPTGINPANKTTVGGGRQVLETPQALRATLLDLVGRSGTTFCGAGGATTEATTSTARSGSSDREGSRRGRRSATKARRTTGGGGSTIKGRSRAAGTTTATSGRYFSIANVSKAVLYLSNSPTIGKRHSHAVKWNTKIIGHY